MAAVAGGAFSPATLFTNGEQGVWFDNSDLTTLFQDSAGTTPVTGYEQFVGLRLDKSKGLVLGSELVDTANTAAAWIKFANNTVEQDGDAVKITFVDSSGGAYVNLNASGGTSSNLTSGSFYRITGETKINTGTANLRIGGNFTPTNVDIFTISSTEYASFSATVQCSGASPNLQFSSLGSGEIVWIRNISVRELPGNHAFQSTTTARAVLSARYNLLTYTEQFDNAAWTKTALNTTGTPAWINAATAPNGTATADALIPNTVGTYHFSSYGGITVPNATVKFTVRAKANGYNFLGVIFANSGAFGKYFEGVFNLSNGTVENTGRAVTYTGTRNTPVALGDGWYECSITVNSVDAASGSLVQLVVQSTNDPTAAFAGNGTSGVYIWGADLRVANESSVLPAYQRVGAAVNGTSTSIGTPDYDTVGFPAYLRYDGGDWYQTNSIDFSAGATNPPTTGAELVTNGTFDSGTTGWTESSATIAASGGELTVTNSGAAYGYAYQNLSVVSGKRYKVVARIKRGTASSANVQLKRGSTGGTLDLNLSTQSTDWVTLTGVFVAQASTYALMCLNDNQFNGTGFFDSVSFMEVDAAYYPDKMSVFAGVRKLSDVGSSNAAVILELSATSDTNSGTFAVLGSNGYVSPNYTFSFVSGGTTKTTAFTQSGLYSAPVTNIMTGLGDIYGDRTTLRLNATQIAENISDQGTGNYGNYPLYIGARAGSSLFYTGREYGLIVLGRAVTPAELLNTENYMESKTFGKNMEYFYFDELTTATGDLITAADGDQIYMSVNYQ